MLKGVVVVTLTFKQCRTAVTWHYNKDRFCLIDLASIFFSNYIFQG